MRCYSCGEAKLAEDFPRDRTKSSGRMSICRSCDLARRKRRFEASRPPRTCKVCGGSVPARRQYCDACRPKRLKQRERAREQGRDRATPTERGYGTAHQKLRKSFAKSVEAGGVRCARCFEPIIPGEPWDLGHDDFDRSLYKGPEHQSCNRATAGRRVERQVLASSREW